MSLFTTDEGSSLNLSVARDRGLASKPKLNLQNLQIYRLQYNEYWQVSVIKTLNLKHLLEVKNIRLGQNKFRSSIENQSNKLEL